MHVVHFHDHFVVAACSIDLFLACAEVTAAAGEVVGHGVVVPALERDAARVEGLVFYGDDSLVTLLADDDTGVTPCEIVLLPECIERQDEIVDRVGKKVDDHPSDVLPLALDDEDYRLETIDTSQHDDRDHREGTRVTSYSVDQVGEVNAGSRKNDGSQQIDENDETHTETTETAEIFQRSQFNQVVDCGIDPATSLR